LTVGGRPAGEASGTPGRGLFRQLVLAPAVADNIALLYGQFETELVLCLEGEQQGADLVVTDFRMPHILASELGRVQASACRSRRQTVGTWHNHPAAPLGLSPASPVLQARNCYLSRTDILDFQRRKQAAVTVVSCGPRVFAYWWRSDVEAAGGDVSILPPPEGQLVLGEPTLAPAVSSLTQARRR
jgi:hypothetical protein